MTKYSPKVLPGQPPKTKFRGDIEGLRAIAVVFVLVWHAGIAQLPGGFVGVDVFFVISGFLMTKILMDASATTGGVSLQDFWVRRIKRLIPASALVLVATAFATWLFLPSSRLYAIGMDIVAAATYVVNWRMATESVDYLNSSADPSPVQHFWSLSVEEQYYILWPVLLVLIFWFLRKALRLGTDARFHARSVVLYSTLAIGVPSFAWSVHLSSVDPGRAYFVTTTRLWELAIGGLVAIYFVRFAAIPRAVAAVLSWLGLAMVVATGIMLTTTVPFPGSVALVPTVGTALIIALAPAAGTAGPAALLSIRPMTWIGGISYSLYLWHWPFVVIGGYILTDGLRDATVIEKVALTILSVVPAYLSLRYVENPIRRSDWLTEQRSNTYFLGFSATAASLCVAMVVALSIGQAPSVSYAGTYTAASGAGTASNDFGAAALGDDPRTSPAGVPVDVAEYISPRPEYGAADNPPVYQAGCHLDEATVTLAPCVLGAPGAETTIALVGDSHAAQWVSPLIEVAKERDWSLVTNTKSACPYLDVTLTRSDKEYTECQAWNDEITSYLTGPDRPDAVFLSYSRYSPASGDVTKGAVSRIQPLVDEGIPVFLLRDTPWFHTNLPDCVSANRDQLTRCATPRDAALDQRDFTQPDVVGLVPGLQMIDLTDAICPADSCAPVIGGVLVYRDNNHMTATYARTLAPRLAAALPESFA